MQLYTLATSAFILCKGTKRNSFVYYFHVLLWVGGGRVSRPRYTHDGSKSCLGSQIKRESQQSLTHILGYFYLPTSAHAFQVLRIYKFLFPVILGRCLFGHADRQSPCCATRSTHCCNSFSLSFTVAAYPEPSRTCWCAGPIIQKPDSSKRRRGSGERSRALA